MLFDYMLAIALVGGLGLSLFTISFSLIAEFRIEWIMWMGDRVATAILTSIALVGALALGVAGFLAALPSGEVQTVIQTPLFIGMTHLLLDKTKKLTRATNPPGTMEINIMLVMLILSCITLGASIASLYLLGNIVVAYIG